MKEKLLSAFYSLTVPMIAFIALTSRIVLNGAEMGEAVAIIAVGAVYAYAKYLDKQEQAKSKLVDKELADIKNEVSSLKAKSIQTVKTSSDSAKRMF